MEESYSSRLREFERRMLGYLESQNDRSDTFFVLYEFFPELLDFPEEQYPPSLEEAVEFIKKKGYIYDCGSRGSEIILGSVKGNHYIGISSKNGQYKISPKSPDYDPPIPVPNELLEKIIRKSNFSVRSYNCLCRLGIKTWGDLIQKTGDDLMRMKNFGEVSLDEVKRKLNEMGLRLAED